MRKYIGDFYTHYFRGEGLRYSMPALSFSRIIIFTILFALIENFNIMNLDVQPTWNKLLLCWFLAHVASPFPALPFIGKGKRTLFVEGSWKCVSILAYWLIGKFPKNA